MAKLNKTPNGLTKIALPTIEGLQMIPIDTIVSCESDDNYTTLKLKNGKKLLVTRSLKDIEEGLEQHSFLRVHRSWLINLNEIEKYIKGQGGYLVMTDGNSIDVARNKKETLMKKLLPYKE
jgi:two-component system LytT family response regulator